MGKPIIKDKSWTVTRNNVVRTFDDYGLQEFKSNVAVCPCSDKSNGSTNPGWRQKVLYRQEAGTPYSRESVLLNVSSPTVVSGKRYRFNTLPEYRKQWLEQTHYISYPPSDALNQDLSSLDGKAMAQFNAKVNSAYRSMNGGVILGEIRKTVGMIKRPAQAIGQELRNFLNRVKKRGRMARSRDGRIRRISDPGVASAISRAVSGSWLEMQFGWKPLLRDLDDTVKTAAQIIENLRPEVKRVSHTASSSALVYKDTITAGGVAGWGDFYITRSRTANLSVSYYGMVLVRPPQVTGFQTVGLHWMDFVPTIWELIPYSFLIDYFTNLGDIFNALPVLRANPVYLGKTEKREVVARADFAGGHPVAPNPLLYIGETYNASGGRYEATKLKFSRTVITPTDLIPSFSFGTPGNLTRWLNIAALVAQARATTRHVVS